MGMWPAGKPSVTLTPPGLTAFLPILESHMLLHTWPEDDEAILDVWSCRVFNAEDVTWWTMRYLDAGVSEAIYAGGPNGFL